MTFSSKWISRLLAVVILAGTAGWVYLGGAPERPTPTIDTAQNTAQVATTLITPEQYQAPIVLTGFTKAAKDEMLFFEIPGVVETVMVEKGDTVEEGDTIATLVSTVTQANLEKAKAQLALAQAKVDRLNALMQSGTTTETALEEAQANLANARSELVSAQDSVDNKTLKAPFSGRINGLDITPGISINANTPVVHILDTSTILIDTYISPTEFDAIDPTAPATLADTKTATLTFLSTSATTNRTFKAEYTLANTTDIPINARVTLVAQSKPVIAASIDLNTIVIDAQGQTGLMVVENDTAQFMPVTVISSREKTWVAGMTTPTFVITAGQNTVTPGQKVSVQ